MRDPLVSKQDVPGRVRVPVELRLEVVAEFRRSGLSGGKQPNHAWLEVAIGHMGDGISSYDRQ